MGTLYKYVGNVLHGDTSRRVDLDPGADGEPRFLELDGPPVELSNKERDAMQKYVVLVPGDEDELPKPAGVPENYDELTANEVVDHLESASPEERDAIVAYEKEHDNRKTVLSWKPSEEENE